MVVRLWQKLNDRGLAARRPAQPGAGWACENGRAEVTRRSPGDGRATWWLVGMAIALLLTIIVAIGLGPVFIAPEEVVQIVRHHVIGQPVEPTWSRSNDAIIWEVRTPRVLLGAVVGATLGICGMTLQAVVRNPLAEPYILGVSAGASTGAAAAILFGVGSVLGGLSTSMVAFLGALAAMLLVMVIAHTNGAAEPARLLVAGVAVGYLLSSVTSLLILFADSAQSAQAVVFWLLGSLAQAEWSTLPVVGVMFALALALMVLWRRRLDVLSLGDETARALGVDPGRTRTVLVLAVALSVGASVAVSGGIGFIGLAIPHMARRVVGVTHALGLPAAAMLGAGTLVWADVVARLILQPREMPIGIITGLIGAPVLVVLVRRLQSVAG
ncbi:MAG: iron ABC transporter permease [Thermomicrobiales bacterium]|nr:iron ABC transporter permease [Thermomicrobiales bacterium]